MLMMDIRLRHRPRGAAWLAAILAALLAGSPAFAQGPDGTITKIEEDWELVIGEPDPESNAPQIFIVTTPTGNIDGTHSVFEINNLSLPDYFGGGLQLQTWYGEYNLNMAHHSSLRTLATTGETVKFTIQMRLWDNWLRFRVKDGTSTTWGSFGGDSLTLYRSTGLYNLTGYSPEHSARLSRVGFSGNRVQRLELKRVRYYRDNNLVSTQELSRVVHDGAALSSQ